MERKPDIKIIESLRDRFGRVHNYLRLSITDRCNLKCIYCMPPDPVFMPAKKLLTVDEIDHLVSVFISMGINKIRLTGGEALSRKEFPKIVNRVVRHGIPLFLTTNGTLIHKHLDLIADTFTGVNISLDTLRSDRFSTITQGNTFRQTVENIKLALLKGIAVKINTVVIRNSNHDEIPEFVELTRKYPVDIRFIEFMPFRNNHWNRYRNFSYEEILEIIQSKYDIERLEKNDTATADMYRVKNAPGRFGIIATVTHPFCPACNRIRVTADGKIKNCLFGRKEYDLQPVMHDTDKLKALIVQSVQEKHLQHGGNCLVNQLGESNYCLLGRTMTAIGG